MTQIDLTAPWHLAQSSTQRQPDGTYHVDATFISGEPNGYEYYRIHFTMMSDQYFPAIRQITNSGLHPREFNGAVLPNPRLFDGSVSKTEAVRESIKFDRECRSRY